MIFITIGTDHHPFRRVFDWIKEARKQKIIGNNERVLIQHGYTEGDWSTFEAYKFLPFNKMIEYIKEADLVITHASSTALLVMRYGKLPIVIPRRKHFKEHVDDHQWDFVESTHEVMPFIVTQTKIEFFDVLSNRDFAIKVPEEFYGNGGDAAVDRFKKLLDELE